MMVVFGLAGREERRVARFFWELRGNFLDRGCVAAVHSARSPGNGLYDNFLVEDTHVTPEPSTLVLAALGLLGMLLLGARRRRS